MQKTKIEWTDYTWNPIKGICPVGCWYCYAQRIYKRFKLDPTIRPSKEYSEIISMPLFDRKRRIISRKVFVCSTIELFHPSIKETWRDWIFEIIKYNPQHTFQILTKFPQNIDRPMPDNVWLGVTVDEPKNQIRISELKRREAKIKFVSFEPMLGRMNNIFFQDDELHLELLLTSLSWIIIGKLTQYGDKYNPQKKWIQEIVNKSKELNIPIFLKDNLKEIWGGPLIQEFPCVE